MTMGKGGVGKTTLAAAIAIALVDRGHEVTLSTTDPAAHITDALADDAPDGLMVERIDPAVETARYTDEVLAAAAGLDEEGRALLEEDLRSPCTEEIAVFRAFARTVDAARERIVVLDTAPTGHTLLLLDAAQSYQREVQAHQRTRARRGLRSARAPARPRVRADARRHARGIHARAGSRAPPSRPAPRGIEPFGWVINASLLAGGTTHPTLRARAAAELTHIAARARGLRGQNVAHRLATRRSRRRRRTTRTRGRRHGSRALKATALFVCPPQRRTLPDQRRTVERAGQQFRVDGKGGWIAYGRHHLLLATNAHVADAMGPALAEGGRTRGAPVRPGSPARDAGTARSTRCAS